MNETLKKLPIILLINRALIFKDNKILLLKRSKNDLYQPGSWEVPGGKLEKGEDCIEKALAREVKEEANINIEFSSKPSFFQCKKIIEGRYNGTMKIVLFHFATAKDFFIKLSTEHTSYKWETVKNALNLCLTPETREVLLELQKYKK